VDDLRDAVSFHQLVLAAAGTSQYTQKQYLSYEVLFLAYLERKRVAPLLDELNLQRVREFLAWYRNQPHPRRTRGGEVAVRAAADILKRLGQILEDNEYVEVNPLHKLRRPIITKFTRIPFTTQELSAMHGACFRTMHAARDETLFLLLLDTGMRIGEACAIRVEQIDQAAHTVVVMGKGRRERLIPIGDSEKRDGGRVMRSLNRYMMLRREALHPGVPMPYLFVARDGKRLTAAGGNDVIKRVAALASVTDAYPHRLRHTFATHYLTVHPGDEIGLRRIMGHVSKNVLADYVHLAQSTIAQRAGQASIAEMLLG
jgi:site-specific recombinase XerD